MATLFKSPKRLCIVIPFLLALVCLVSVQTAGASAPRQYNFQSTIPGVSPTPPPTPGPTNPPNNGATGGSTSSGGGNIFTYIYESIVKFANDTVASGIMFGLDSLVRGIADKMKEPVDQGINASISHLTSNDPDGQGTYSAGNVSYLWETRFQAWRAILVVSSLLLPVTLLATVVMAMRGGMSSFAARSDAKEALSQWFISVALAGASYFLLFQGFRFSEAFTGYINNHLLTEVVTSGGVVNIKDLIGIGIITLIVSGLMTIFAGPPGAALAIFCFFFVILGAIFIFVSLGLASLAKDVILFIVVAVAPLVCILSPVQPFRWIFNAWLKVAAGALLLVPGNALLWRLGSFLVIHTLNTVKPSRVGDCIYAILLWIGIASIIVSLNWFVGKLVYSAAIDVAQKAAKATMDTVGLALKATGFSDGTSLSSGFSPSTAGGGGGYAGSGHGNGTDSGSLASSKGTDSGSLASPFGKMASKLNSNPSVLGSFLKSSGLPLLSDYGAGLDAGLRAGQTSGPSSSQPHPDGPFPGEQKAVESLKSQGFSESDAQSKVGQYSAGLHTAEKELGVSSDDIVRSYGYKSHEEYFTAGASAGAGKGSLAPPPKDDAPLYDSPHSKVHDVYYANQVMAKYNQPLDSPQYANVLKTVHDSHTRGGDSHPNIMYRMNTPQKNEKGEKEEYASNLNQWLANEKDRMRRRGAG